MIKMEQVSKKLIHEKRVEEEAMALKIYKKIRILAMTNSHSNEFRQLIKKNILLENNSTAVLHVLHFLFTLHDPEDCKKRLLWPCYEKNQEATARKQFVVFLNEKNDKHKLDFETVTTFLLLKPTGIKFLTMLDKFILFVMMEEIKRSRNNWMDYKSRLVDIKDLPKLLEDQQHLVGALKDYKRKLTTKIAEASLEVQELSGILNRALSGTAFANEDPFNGGLTENFQHCLKKTVDEIRAFITQNGLIIHIGELLQEQLSRSADEYSKDAIFKEITESVDAIKNLLIDDTMDEFDEVLENKCLNFCALMQILHKMEDKLLANRKHFIYKDADCLHHERKVLAELVIKAKVLKDNASVFERQLKICWNRCSGDDDELPKSTQSSDILDNIILTPQISFKFNVKQKMSRHLQRLALADETYSPNMNISTDCNETVMNTTVMEQSTTAVSAPKTPPKTPSSKSSVGARVLSMLRSNSKRTNRALLENMNSSMMSQHCDSSVSEYLRNSSIVRSSPKADVSMTLRNRSRSVVDIEYSKQTSPSGRLKPLVEYNPDEMRHALNWSDCSDDVVKPLQVSEFNDKENDSTIMNANSKKSTEEKNGSCVFDKSSTAMESLFNISDGLLVLE